MATSYSHTSWGHTVGYWWYEVSESNINTSNNTSKITVNFYVKAAHGNQRSDTYNNYPAGYGSSTPYSNIYINGTLITTKNPACFDIRYNSDKKIANGTTYHLGTASATIKHNSNGGGSVTVKCQHYTSVSPNWVTLESSHGLTTIDTAKAADVSASGTYNIGNNFNVKISGGNGDSHTIRLQYGSLTHDVATLGRGTHSINIPASWKPSVTAGSSVWATIYCYTYKGGRHIGTATSGITIKNSDGGATLSLPSGTHNIGSKFQFTLKNCKSYLRYSIWCYSGKNSGWIQHSNQAQYSDGNHTITFNEIPYSFKNGVANQGTDTMYVVVYTYHNGVHVASDTKSATIKNNDYVLNINKLYIRSDTYTENSKYTAGKTRFYICYEAESTFDIKRVEFKMWGSNSNSGGWDWPGRASAWDSGIVYGIGELGIKCTITDSAGHQTSKDIYTWVHEEEHRLSITKFEQQNGNIYIQKKHTIGSTKFKLYVAWDNTHTITKIKYEVTGANPMSYTKNNPGGKSFTWTTDSVTKVGDNTIKVTITDSKGSSKSSTIYVKTTEEPANIVVDDSKIDTSLCVDLVKGLAYKDYSRLGVKLNIVHSHRLQTIKVTINGREHSLKNFDANASTFTLIDDKKIEKSGYVTIKVYAKDVNGKSDDYSFTYMIYEIIKPPKKPTIAFEKQPKLYLSEGEKIIFYGESKDIKDYQIIYVLSACDVINATKFCDSITNSYLGANNTTLTTNLNQNATGTLRYHIFKDFGVSNSPIQYKNAEFHLRL